MADVFTLCTEVRVQIQILTNTLLKVKVLICLFFFCSSESKEVQIWKFTEVKRILLIYFLCTCANIYIFLEVIGQVSASIFDSFVRVPIPFFFLKNYQTVITSVNFNIFIFRFTTKTKVFWNNLPWTYAARVFIRASFKATKSITSNIIRNF